MPATPKESPIVPNGNINENIYNIEIVNAILSDYAYFETFTGTDPANRESKSSKFIAKHAKCYQNVRDQNLFLLVWYVNDDTAQLEYLSSEELEKLQVYNITISTSAHPIDQQIESLPNKVIHTEPHEPLKHMRPFIKASLDLIIKDYDIFENFIGTDPYARVTKSDHRSIAKCFKNKYMNDNYVLIWDIYDECFLPEEVSEVRLEDMQSSNILDLHRPTDANMIAMEFVDQLDLRNVAKPKNECDVKLGKMMIQSYFT
jgi:hypothetical protein